MYEVIKIPDKTFNDLSLYEVSLMIDADSTISPSGNEFFASCALDEFLHFTELTSNNLKIIRNDILKNLYIDIKDSKIKKINIEYLKILSIKLKTAKKIEDIF